MKMLKKGNVSGVQIFIMAIVGVAVVLGVGLLVLAELQGSMTVDSAAYNATGSIITKLAAVPTWVGILITVTLAFLVLGYFYSRR